MGKAQNIVNSSVDSMKGALSSLNQAMMNCEKQENKNIIQSAINSINSACNNLSNFQD